ncbi:MAG: hypothetical protein UT30_C0026G0011, partial [Candidatus Uhrbacteria bacterium GW2011_GWF2_39_13]
LVVKHKNGRKLIIATDTLDGANTEAEALAQSALIQALARAHAWVDAIESGEIRNLQELSEKINFDRSYMGRILHLVNLAPDLQENILDGCEPDGLSLAKLLDGFPDNWSEQRQFFKISA